MSDLTQAVRETIVDVPDFPKDGILFKDITPVLRNPSLFSDVVDWFVEQLSACGANCVAGIESRGFIFGAAVAQRANVPLLLIRKPGKLPRDIHSESYELEYGTDSLELHQQDCGGGDKVFLVDDLLATGGTAGAAAALVEKTGADVSGFGFMIELGFLDGRDRLEQHDVYSLVTYD
jgi:adenine phosphoribosyltransferase